MTNHQHDRGIILIRRDVGEADRLLKFFTREHGALWLRAKGVRRAQAKLAGALEPLTEAELSFVEGRSISTLTGARVLMSFQSLLEHYEALICAQSLAEITDACFPDNTPEQTWYDWLISAYHALLEDGANPLAIQKIWVASLAHHLQIAGLSPEFPHHTDRYDLNIQDGRFVTSGGELLSATARKWWWVCLTRDLKQVLSIGGADTATAELAPVLERFWHYQTGVQMLRSRALS